MRSATAFLAAYRDRMAQWPYREIKPEPGILEPLLVRAGWAWPGAYAATARGYPFALTYRSSGSVVATSAAAGM